ncbi:hypothetical protein [Conyzicola sp.]|uniref:hypothetical protein n=1 Tax=Conyzicola sp. TaxID=1969404 RepID=UPI0039894C3D
MTTESFGSLDDLPESADVASRTPRIIITVVALLVAAILAVVVVVFAVGTLAHLITVGGEADAVALPTVAQNIGIDLPDDTEVLATTRADGYFSAVLLLPPDELPDFPLAGYATVDSPSAELARAIEGEAVVEYLAAASSELEASAAIVDRGGDAVLFVDVRAVR